MKQKNILITGGAGFIGSNLTHALAQDNTVIVLDNLSTGHIKNIQDLIKQERISFIKADITDIDTLQQNFADIDIVFHQAALTSVPRSVKDPIATNHVNIIGTLNVLTAARNNQVSKVISASSSSIYGDTPTLPKKEDMPYNPISPYAVSKTAGELYCNIFTSVYKLPTVSLRYFNVYGPCQDPLSEYAAVIPKFIINTMNDKSPIIFGDGGQTRDFTFVKDVVAANIGAAESNATGVFNIAGGKRITINNLAEKIIAICKKEMDLTHIEERIGDVKHSLADISKASSSFGYSPHYSIDDGLVETLQWFQQTMFSKT